MKRRFSMKKDFLYKSNQDGLAYYDLDSWDDFINIVDNNKAIDFNAYLWRGQRKSVWPLASTLDRLLSQYDRQYRDDLRSKHLHNFMYAVRGRRGSFPRDLTANEYWALGQHYGLATPLLDWTSSPYIASFFALHQIPFLNLSADEIVNGSFALYAINELVVENKMSEINLDDSRRITFINPLMDDNPRLVTQSGVFTKVPSNTDLESWIKSIFKGEQHAFALFKFTIPYTIGKKDNVKDILLSLSRMNINASTLFPDLHGSSLFSNMKLAIPRY